MRSACSTGVTKILPSPILPVCAAFWIASTALDLGVVDHDLDLTFGQEAHQVLGAAIDFGLALLPAEPLDLSLTVRPDTPTPVRASRTSSSLNGLMMADTIFMRFPDLRLSVDRLAPALAGVKLEQKVARRRQSHRAFPVRPDRRDTDAAGLIREPGRSTVPGRAAQAELVNRHLAVRLMSGLRPSSSEVTRRPISASMILRMMNVATRTRRCTPASPRAG